MVTIAAGCTGNGSEETGGTVDGPTDPASFTPEESDVITDIEFEKEGESTAALVVTVSDVFSKLNVVSQDGLHIGGTTFPTGVTRVTVIRGTRFNLENTQFVALDDEGEELETITRIFIPELTYSNFFVDGTFETEVVDGKTR